MTKRIWIGIGLFVLFVLLVLGGYYAFFSNELPGEKAKWQERDKKVQELETKLHDLADRIQAAQGQSSCEADSDCRIVGMGTKTCGKFNDFLIYSIRDAQEPAVLSLVSEFNRLHEALSNLSLTSARCGVTPAAVHCVSKQCIPDEKQ